MLVPKFRLEESWDGAGDIDIWFIDSTSSSLIDRVRGELNDVMATLDKHDKNVYHLEKIVDNILLNMRKSSNLRRSTGANQWVFKEEVDYG